MFFAVEECAFSWTNEHIMYFVWNLTKFSPLSWCAGLVLPVHVNADNYRESRLFGKAFELGPYKKELKKCQWLCFHGNHFPRDWGQMLCIVKYFFNTVLGLDNMNSCILSCHLKPLLKPLMWSLPWLLLWGKMCLCFIC